MMLRLIIPIALMLSIAAVVAPKTAIAAELIVVEQKDCHWCLKWQQDIGRTYGSTPVAQIAPLRRVDLHERKPTDLAHIDLGRYTPAFILVAQGSEIGRIRGYPGVDTFWYLLKQQLAKLPFLRVPAEEPIAKTNYPSPPK